MRYNPDAQAAYEELARRGYFKDNPDALSAAEELARRGVLQVGMFPKKEKRTPAPAPSRASTFLLETPQDATADLLGRTSATRLTDAVSPFEASPLDTNALPRKVADRVAPRPKQKPKPAAVSPEYAVSSEKRREAMREKAKGQPSRRRAEDVATARPQPLTGSLFNPEDALRAYMASPDAQLRRFLQGSPAGKLIGAPAVNRDAMETARIFGLSPEDASLYGVGVQEAEDAARGELGAFGRAFGENALPGAGALAAGRFASRLLPGPWKLAGIPLAFGGAMAAQAGQGQVQRSLMGELEYQRYQQQLAEERAKYPVSTFFAEQIPFLLTSRAVNPLTRQGAIAGGIDAAGETAGQVYQNVTAPEGQKPGYDLLRILGSGLTGSVFSGADTGIGRRAFAPVDRLAANVAQNPTVGNALLNMAPDAYLRENFGFDPSRAVPGEALGPGGTTYPLNAQPREKVFPAWESYRDRPVTDPRRGEVYGPPAPTSPLPGSSVRPLQPAGSPAYDPLRESVAGPYTRTGIRSYEALSEALQDPQGFGYDKETADATATIWESIARSWAERNGKRPGDWYRRYVAGITNGGEEIARALLEEKGMDPNIAPDIAGATQGTRRWTSDPTDVRQVVAALSSPNASTASHELAHVFRKQLGDEAMGNDAVRADVQLLEQWAGVKNGKWDSKAEERFARAYERWLSTGNAPNESLSGVFGRFREWITDVYQNLVELVGGKPALERFPAFNKEVISMLSRYMGDVSDITGQGVKQNETAISGTATPAARQRQRPDLGILPGQTAPLDGGGLGSGSGARGAMLREPAENASGDARAAGNRVPPEVNADAPPEYVDPDSIQVMPGMQFKREIVDPKANVTDQLKNQKDYDVYEGGVLTVWEGANGTRYAVDGHHRLELARRAKRFIRPGADGNYSEAPRQILVQVLKESDGWTPETAKAWGIRRNLREGKARAIDAADALLTLGDKARSRSDVSLLPKNAVSRDTLGLLELSEDSRAMVRNGTVSESVAAGIGEALRGDSARQARAMKSAAKSPAIRTYEDGLTLGGRVADEELIARDSGQMGMFGDVDFEDTIAKQTEIIGAVKKRLGAEKSKLLATENTEERPGEVFDTEGRRKEAGQVSEAKSKADALIAYDPDVKAAIRSLSADVLKKNITQDEAVKRLRDVMLKAGRGSVAEITARGAKPAEEPTDAPPSPYRMEEEGQADTPDTETFSMFDEPEAVPVGRSVANRDPLPIPTSAPLPDGTPAGSVNPAAKSAATTPESKSPASPGQSSVSDIEARIESVRRDLAEAKARVRAGEPFAQSRVDEIEKRLKGLRMQLSAAKKAQPVETAASEPAASNTSPSKTDLDFDLTRPIADVASASLKRAGIEDPTPQQTELVSKGIRWGRERITRAEAEWEGYRLLDYDRGSGNAVVQSTREDENGNRYTYSVNLKNGFSSDPDSMNRLKAINDELAALGVRERVVSKHTQIARRLVEKEYGELPPPVDDVLFQQNKRNTDQIPAKRVSELLEDLDDDFAPDDAWKFLYENGISEQDLKALQIEQTLRRAKRDGATVSREEMQGWLQSVASRKLGGMVGASVSKIGDGSPSNPVKLGENEVVGNIYDKTPSLTAELTVFPQAENAPYTNTEVYGLSTYKDDESYKPQKLSFGNAFHAFYDEKLGGHDFLEDELKRLGFPDVIITRAISTAKRGLGTFPETLLETMRQRPQDIAPLLRERGLIGPAEKGGFVKPRDFDKIKGEATLELLDETFRSLGYDGIISRSDVRDLYPDSPGPYRMPSGNLRPDLEKVLAQKEWDREFGDELPDSMGYWGDGEGGVLFQRNRRQKDTETLDIFSDASNPATTANAGSGKGKGAVPVRQRDLFVDQGMIDEAPRRGQQTFDDTTHGGLFAMTPAPEGETDDGQGSLFQRNARQERQIRSPQFKEWFGDWEKDPQNASKVVDENGEPLVVYHSSGEKFTKFDITKARSYNPAILDYDLPGFYFTANKREAEDYGGVLTTAYLSLKNPYIGDVGQYKKEGGYKTWRETRDALIRDGYDGVIVEDYGEIIEYVALQPTQIKSATGNTGDFDPNNPDILFSRNRRQNPAQGQLPGTRNPNLPPPSSAPPAGPRPPRPPRTASPQQAIQNQLPGTFAPPPQQERQMSRIIGQGLLDVANSPKSAMSSMDISGPGRQGAVLGVDNPKEWAKAWGPMLSSFKRKGYERTIEEIHTRPNAPLYAKYGLFLASRMDADELLLSRSKFNPATGVGGSALTRRRLPRLTKQQEAKLYGPEESFASNLFAKLADSKIPIISQYAVGVESSGRAYTAFLDRLRADVFDKYVEELKAAGLDPNDKSLTVQREFENIARWVNIATGRGELIGLDNVDPRTAPDAARVAAGIKTGLNLAAFAPRYAVSRVQSLNPYTWAAMTPQARTIAMRNYLKFHGAVLTTLTLAAIAGRVFPQIDMSVSIDPEESDFGKVRIGDWTYDVTAGTSQYIRTVARLLLKKDAGKVVSDFARTKASPTMGYATDLTRSLVEKKKTGKDANAFMSDKPFNAVTGARDLFIPLPFKEGVENYKKAGPSSIPMGAIPSAVGIGVNNYPQKGRVSPDQAEKKFRETLMRMNEKQKKPRTLTPSQEKQVQKYREMLESLRTADKPGK